MTAEFAPDSYFPDGRQNAVAEPGFSLFWAVSGPRNGLKSTENENRAAYEATRAFLGRVHVLTATIRISPLTGHPTADWCGRQGRRIAAEKWDYRQ